MENIKLSNTADNSVIRMTILLQKKNLLITTAESCTGGLIASYLTALSGSSAWFERGFVTYSNIAKQEMLGVSESLIEKHGAVSIEVAEAMAVGALNHSHANVSLSVTGIAGPGGGSTLKPVGTACFAWAIRSPNSAVKFQCKNGYVVFPPTTREDIRIRACHYALNNLVALLEKEWADFTSSS